MALLRKLFARKAMDGLSCISERVYVFNSCLSMDPLVDDDDDEEARNDHLISTVIQLKSCHPHGASLMLLNLFAGGGGEEASSLLPVDALRRHGVAAVAEYPCGHRHGPSLPLATARALLATCVDWLVTDGQRNVLLMRCDRRARPALALAMASLLVYMEEEPAPPDSELVTTTTATLAAVYGRAPVALLAAGSALDPRPSHLRYLQYVTRLRGMTTRLEPPPPPLLVLDCLILRPVPDFDGNGGCRPVVRVHGRRGDDDGDPVDDVSPKILFSTPRIKQHFRQYNQVLIYMHMHILTSMDTRTQPTTSERLSGTYILRIIKLPEMSHCQLAKSAVVKVNIECQVRGDVVVECGHVGENTDEEEEEAMFRIMFNTCFVESNMMVLTLDDIDLPWNCRKERFQEDFKIEVFFSEVDVSDNDSHTAEMLGDSHEGNAELFYDFDDISIDSGSSSKYHEQHDEDGESKSSEPGGCSSDEKVNNGSGIEVRFMPESDVTKDSLEEETGNQQEESSNAVQPTLVSSKDPNLDKASDFQESTSQEACIQEGAGTSVRTEVDHNSMAGIGALKPQPKRRTWQNLSKQSAIPIVNKKKAKKPDIGSSDVKKPSKGKMLLKQTLQKGILIATSSCKSSTVQANTGPVPRKKHGNAIRANHGTGQATKTPTHSKTDLKNSSHQEKGDRATQKDDAIENTIETEPATSIIQTRPSSPPRQGLNQDSSKDSLGPIESAMKSPTPRSGDSVSGGASKQEATTASTEAHSAKVVLKKSLSSSAISRSLTTTSSSSSSSSSSPKRRSNVTSHPSSVLLKAASSSSPRARASPLPPVLLKVASSSSPRARASPSPPRSPLASSKDASPCIIRRVHLHEWAFSVAENIDDYKEPSHWHERQQQKLVTSITKIGKATAITTRGTYYSYHSTSKANKI
uniref:C2 tensin-type domain-containing protein n=1 Tax=Oryza rufipogon TaxID=4529 RepID=A0A0E0NWU3_ORYRU